jgi:RNA polymerase sigma-70 factor (ECF subfamily)
VNVYGAEIDEAVLDVLRGDREAFRLIIERHEASLRMTIAAMVPHGTPVDDLVQEAFISAYLHLGDYRPGSDFAAWIRTFARHIALNERRRLRRRSRLGDELFRQVEDGMAVLVDQQFVALVRREARQSLRECVEGLSEAARRVVDGFYSRALSTRQIARDFDRPEPWVRVMLFRARSALARCLEQKGVAEHG